MAIPQSFLQELLSRTDVVEVVGRYVQLKKAGANYMGLCPFHGEKSPSFSVSPTKQFYHCFGCGKNGNAIGFLMEHAGMNFVEAVKELAQQHGMQVPDDDASPQDRARAAQQREKQATLTDVLEKAGEAYRRHLRSSPRAIEYFKGRGVSGEVAKRFGLGYAPEGWRSLASVFPNYDDPLLVESGLVILHNEDGSEEKRYDRFRDRVMFPILNIKGECIGFGGRVLGEGTPKYLNSPETPVFSKGRELYGLFEARNALREHGYVLVTEGYMDVVALAQLGFPNAVATLGTACTTDHVQKLFRFTDAVVFSFDGDAAGRRAARKALDGALPYASDVRSVKFLFLPPEHDPDSFIREFGKDAFSRYVSEATPLSRFLIESAREGCDLSTAEGRAHMAANARPLWTQLPEGALKRQLLSEISELVQLTSAELTDIWAQTARGRAGGPARRSEDGSGFHDAPPHEGWRDPLGGEEPRRGRGEGRRSGAYRGGGSRSSGPSAQGTARTPRTLPASRADHAARLLLGNLQAWDSLTGEDHALLSELPAPHGPLFVWLEGELHEHGAQPWTALRESVRGLEFGELALRLMQFAPSEDEAPPPAETFQELRALLNLMLVDRLKVLETEALMASKDDPAALQRYRELQERRRALLTPTPPSAS